MKTLVNKFITVSTAIVLAGVSSLAMAKEQNMICAVSQAISCQKGTDCVSGSADDLGIPQLMRVNPDKKEIITVNQNGEKRTSTIRQSMTDQEKRFVVYQGVEPGGAWSTVIDTTTGNMTISVAAGETDAYTVFGNCSATILK